MNNIKVPLNFKSFIWFFGLFFVEYFNISASEDVWVWWRMAWMTAYIFCFCTYLIECSREEEGIEDEKKE